MLNYSNSVVNEAFLIECQFNLCPSHRELLRQSGLDWNAVAKIWKEQRQDALLPDILDKLRQRCEKLSGQ